MNVYTLTLYKLPQFYLRANLGIINFEKASNHFKTLIDNIEFRHPKSRQRLLKF